ncbi:MAG: Holliday junction branch migration DNA helicase RuvB [Candidatus Gracilibacteria bacterium]|nr:Holliday junction branch migration DNA helicase RuvB [Candidatus Gracilibacteria bacterium]MDD3119975.1 Holliday junction branch migration DNA helicase RuvB [Candidatus Gracilibacteria bacterium]MDD4530081.1 Holliday junction branch migration DNA helicase RuvB [Candidatus Gracilibacteria bacterium]
MAIKSVKQNNRTVEPQEKKEDIINENSLRPKRLEEYIGQAGLKKHLKILLDSARIRKEPLDHILFYGPPGLGKTTISNIIANEMQTKIKSTSGPAIEKQADLISVLTSLEFGDILFIDEIHRLKPQIEEILYSAMEDFNIDIIIGSGNGATSIKMDIPKFCLIGATTKLSKLSNPLRDRFANVIKLDFYDENELSIIIERSLRILDCEIKNPEIYQVIAKKSRGTPRIANRFVKIIRDYNIVGHSIKSELDIEKIFEGFGIDKNGLDVLDKKILESLLFNFAGRPVGLNTLASIIGEDESTIEDVIEPYLLKIGFLERTPKGRKITLEGEKYLRK